MTTSHDMEGTPVSEGEVATGLGFANINEFRRWQTDIGHENSELKHALYKAKNESDGFRWSLKRCLKVLERVSVLLKHSVLPLSPETDETVLAVNVMISKEVDWGNKLKWLYYDKQDGEGI